MTSTQRPSVLKLDAAHKIPWMDWRECLRVLATAAPPTDAEMNTHTGRLIRDTYRDLPDAADEAPVWLLERYLGLDPDDDGDDEGESKGKKRTPKIGLCAYVLLMRPAPAGQLSAKMQKLKLLAGKVRDNNVAVSLLRQEAATYWHQFGQSDERRDELLADLDATIAFARKHGAPEIPSPPPPPPPPPTLSTIGWEYCDRDVYAQLLKFDAPPQDDIDGLRTLDKWLASPASGPPDIAPLWMRAWQLEMYLKHHPIGTARQIEVLATHPWSAHQGGVTEKLRKMQMLIDCGAPPIANCEADMRTIGVVDRVYELELDTTSSFNIKPETAEHWRLDYGATRLFLEAHGAQRAAEQKTLADLDTAYPPRRAYTILMSQGEPPASVEEAQGFAAWLHNRRHVSVWCLREWQLKKYLLVRPRVADADLCGVAMRVRADYEGGFAEKKRIMNALIARGAAPSASVYFTDTRLPLVEHLLALDAKADDLPREVAAVWHADLRATRRYLQGRIGAANARCDATGPE